MIPYGYQRIIRQPFQEVEAAVRARLQERGFGVLTEIDVQATMQAKLNQAFRSYKILGVCNPSFAFQALSAELEIGLLLPCNVVLWENDDQSITLAAVDAGKLLSVTGRADLQDLAERVNGYLREAIDAV